MNLRRYLMVIGAGIVVGIIQAASLAWSESVSILTVSSLLLVPILSLVCSIEVSWCGFREVVVFCSLANIGCFTLLYCINPDVGILDLCKFVFVLVPGCAVLSFVLCCVGRLVRSAL